MRKRKFLTKTDLIQERFWTAKLIKELLGNPDKKKVSKLGRESNLYSWNRVFKKENSEEFKISFSRRFYKKVQNGKEISKHEHKIIRFINKDSEITN